MLLGLMVDPKMLRLGCDFGIEDCGSEKRLELANVCALIREWHIMHQQPSNEMRSHAVTTIMPL